MEDKTPSLEDPCLAPGITHNMEFIAASFGTQCWNCTLCNLWIDELDDSQP